MTLADVDLSRVLEWEGCHNVRDLGGLPTQDGRRTRKRALVRSDLPSRLTERGRQALLEHGVRTIVDLRYADEVAVDAELYPFRDEADAGRPIYQHVPFAVWDDSPSDRERVALYRAAQSRAELNRLDLDLHSDGVAAAVAAIADAPPGGVLIHCHAGKDRTGIVTALVLSLLGVDDKVIADDYALTSLNLEPLIADWLDSLSDNRGERERLRTLADPVREAMLDTLAHLRDRYGSAAAYLEAAGLSNTQVERLRSRMLEET